ncbi:hypothetical protein HID58_046287 [Brassica napus]|uniref:Terpene synthase metal-binding domain-containing protein n=1 Tax=Brassica napus TaxID=3708 RepID=A0ABQ8AW19_BRANA|nr:hypothetical protein HID58_046287 [Brassica napus]
MTSPTAPVTSDLPFDFRYSYSETNPAIKPIGFRERNGSLRSDRVDWTGTGRALALQLLWRVIRGNGRVVRDKILGEALTEEEGLSSLNGTVTVIVHARSISVASRSPYRIPDSMKHFYRVIVDFYEKLSMILRRKGANGYMQEAKWLKKDYTAKFDEYKESAIVSSGYYGIMAVTFAGMGDVAKLDAFEWLSSHPKIRVASEERAAEEIFNIVSNAWKDLNQELMRPHSVNFSLLMPILNLSRVIHVFYRYQDAYTHPEFLKEHVVSLLVENIPI